MQNSGKEGWGYLSFHSWCVLFPSKRPGFPNCLRVYYDWYWRSEPNGKYTVSSVKIQYLPHLFLRWFLYFERKHVLDQKGTL